METSEEDTRPAPSVNKDREDAITSIVVIMVIG